MDLPIRFHIGTPRAGSSFLFNLLKAHPDVSLSPSQKINFYSEHFERGFDWYLGNFVDDGCPIDTSPTYFLQGDRVGPRIKQAVGTTLPLFLLVLRNPIDYTYSHYQMQIRQGFFTRRRDLYPYMPNNFAEFAYQYPEWSSRGKYAEILQLHWFPHFDAKQFKILLFEDLVQNTHLETSAILSFFRLPPHPISTVASSRNTTLRYPSLHYARRALNKLPRVKRRLKQSSAFNYAYEHYLTDKSSKLGAHDRADLARLFRDDVNDLKQLLGHGIRPWQDFASQAEPGSWK
jgi:hypothetical protein